MLIHRLSILPIALFGLFLISGEATATQYFTLETQILPSADRIVRVTNNTEMSAAISNAQPGDRIVIANGNYAALNLVGLQGQPGKPIVFTAENPRQVIISGSTSGRNARLSDCIYLEFHGIRYTSASVWGFTMGPSYSTDTAVGCHYIRIINCEFDNAGQELLAIGGNSSHIEIIGNSLHDSGMVGSGKPYAEGIYIGNGKSLADRSHDILIQGNHLYRIGNTQNGGEAIDIKVQAYNITVIDNLIENVIVRSQGAIAVLINDANYPEGQTNPNILISRNVIHNVRRLSTGWDGAGIFVGANGVTVTNNLVWDTESPSLLATSNASNTTGNLEVYNNTFWDGVQINQSSLGGANKLVYEIMKNNLISGGGGSSADKVASSSDFIGPLSGDAMADQFIGSGFQLKSSSTAVASADYLSTVVYDLTGAYRPTDAYSYGAFDIEGAIGNPTLYEVTFESGLGGSVEGYVYQEIVEQGSTDSVLAVPQTGYAFARWSGDYNGSTNPLILSNISETTSVIANFTTIEQEILPSESTIVTAINCGGEDYLASDGIAYSADQFYTGGTNGSKTDTVENTEDSALYQRYRFNNFAYDLPVGNGEYKVTLKFVESYWTADNRRIFDISLEGQLTIDDLDLHATVGHDAAYDVVIETTVIDGQLNISSSSSYDHATIAAIVVERMTLNEEAPALYDFVDTDNDGLVNLLEHALKLDATNPSDARTDGPKFKIANANNQQHLEIEFRRLVGGSGDAADGYTSDGLFYTVECNESLGGSWLTGSNILQEVGSAVDNGDGTETVTVRIRSTLLESPQMFIRLSVSRI